MVNNGALLIKPADEIISINKHIKRKRAVLIIYENLYSR
jgi:hypothetical protein